MIAEARKPPGRSRRLLLGGLTSVATLALLLAGTEVLLRLRAIPFNPTWIPSENAMARFDPELGWVYVPDRSHERTFGEPERRVAIHFDALGSRVARPDAARDPTRPAVLFVGGSFTMGHGLPYEETFPGLLEAEPSFPFQVVNLGVQGYGTDQSLLLLRRQVDELEVVAVVYTFIDKHIRRNHLDDRRLMIPSARFLGTKPLFALRPDGSVYLKKPAARFGEIPQSNLWNWIRLAWYRNSSPPGPDLTVALVREMAAVVRAREARFVLVVWRQGNPSQGLPVIEWDASIGAEVVDTGIDPPGGWNEWIIPGDGHPDAAAHAYVAGLLRETFARLGKLPEDP